jgi:phage baseplate assembly protein gpV
MSIVETMRGVAQKELNKLHLPVLGVVTSIFPHAGASDKDNYECNVRLKNTDIELRKVPIATQCIGLVCIPRVGDLVLLAFINGDVNAPIVFGRLYNDQDRPPVNQAEEVVYIPPYGQNSKVRRVYLEFPGGMTFRITDDELDVNAGKTTVVVKRDGDVIIDSKANINVNADGDTSLKSKGNLTISASSIKMESDKDLNIKSGTDMKVESGATTQIKSASDMTSEATGQMKIKGATVNIN